MAVLQLSIILYYDTLKILKSGLDRGPIIFSPNVSDLKIWIDYKWLNENYKNIPKRIQMSGNDDEVFLYNGNKEKVASIYELKNSLIKKYGQENSSQYVEEIFDKPTFINYAKDGIDWLKINKISFNLSFRTYQDTIEINGDDIVKFILKDVLKDKITNIDPSLHVHLWLTTQEKITDMISGDFAGAGKIVSAI